MLLAGRFKAGWRGVRAVRLYLAGFALLCLAYFGSRIVLEAGARAKLGLRTGILTATRRAAELAG